MEWCRSDCGKYKIESLTAATFPGAIHVFKEGFCKYGNVCIATEVNINPKAIEDLSEMCADAALDGVSVVAVEINSKKVVAVLFNKLQVATSKSEKSSLDWFAEKCCTQPSSKALIRFRADMDRRCNVFEKCGVDCSLELAFLATLREHRHLNLAYLLCKASIDLGKKLKDGPVSSITVKDLGPKYSHIKPRDVTTKVPKICHALGTSMGTQKIREALGFTILLRVSFEEFVYNDMTFTERVGFDPYYEVLIYPLQPIKKISKY